MQYKEIELTDNVQTARFELALQGEIAFIDYKKKSGKLYLIHTEVPTKLEGNGVGTALVEKTLRYAKENNLQVVPLCSFVQSYLHKHPEWKYMVADER